MSLRDIAVRVEASPASRIGGIRPILCEIEALLATWVESGRGGSIDLRSLPLSPADVEALEAALGEGEVYATIRALGETRVTETAVHGVWRVTHCNDDGSVVADFIEVCDAPEILKTHAADARAGDPFRPDGQRVRIDPACRRRDVQGAKDRQGPADPSGREQYPAAPLKPCSAGPSGLLHVSPMLE